jgi:hypothetical protein
MIEKKFTEKIISKIEKDKIKPRPRWKFVFKNYFLWIIGVFSLLFGALSFSLIIYLFNSGENIFSDRFGASFLEVFLVFIPIFWLIFLALFIFLFYLNLKKTKRAYKCSPFFILIIGLISSIALGSSFYMLGFGRKIDNLLGKNINPGVYSRIINPQLEFWSEPEKGRLAGVVSEMGDNKNFFLVDKDSREWLVSYDIFNSKHALRLGEGLVVRCFGEKTSNDDFQASVVMPMNLANDFFDRPGIRRQVDDPSLGPRMELRNNITNDCQFKSDCPFK